MWTSAAAWNKPNSDGYYWYPGDDYVDIVGIDIYNNSSTSDIYTSCFKMLKKNSPDKLIALTECGNVANISKQWRGGSKWLYFAPWYDYDRTNNPNSEAFKSPDHSSCNVDWWKDAFAQDYVLSRDDFKAILTGVEAVQAERGLSPAGTFDLTGRPWVEGRSGLYIRNGKMIIRK